MNKFVGGVIPVRKRLPCILLCLVAGCLVNMAGCFLPAALPAATTPYRHRHYSRWCRSPAKIRCDMMPTGAGKPPPQVGRVPLGSNGLEVSEMGIGTIAWGDVDRGYGAQFERPMMEQAFREMVEGGVSLFDTAEIYGYKGMETNSSSEHLLGSCLSSLAERNPLASGECLAASKFFPVPWTNLLVGGGVRIGRQAVVDAARASSHRLGRPVDLYQLHFPFPYLGGADALCQGLAESVDLGLIKSVGVSNFEQRELIHFHGALGKLGVPLVSNQIKYNIFDRAAEKSGLITLCRDMEVTCLAYEPLEGGILSGKYHNGQHVDGPTPTEKYSERELRAKRPIVNLCRLIGTFDGGKTTAQVALNYIMCKGVVPIPGVKNVAQAREVLGACGWRMGSNDVEVLDERMDFFEKQNSQQPLELDLGVTMPDLKGLLGGKEGGEK